MKKIMAVYEYAPGAIMEGYQTVVEKGKGTWESIIRISEYVEVEFEPVPYEKVLPDLIKEIDKAIDDVQVKAELEVLKLRDKKQQLMAIGYDQKL